MMLRCNSCEALMINGVFCHETGCPESWRGVRECPWCGREFTPESREQMFCDDTCAEAYNT